MLAYDVPKEASEGHRSLEFFRSGLLESRQVFALGVSGSGGRTFKTALEEEGVACVTCEYAV